MNKLLDYVPTARNVLILPPLALKSVTAKDGSAVYASSDTLYRDAIFGRDSLEVAEDLMTVKPKLVHNILLSLGRLQGVVYNPANEEEPGKIIHEYRTSTVGRRQITGKQLQIFHELGSKWGGTDEELAYYGSVDATPQFLRTLGTYCLNHGNSILTETVQKRNGEQATMRQIAEASTAWLTSKIAMSQSGLVEYKRINPHGIENQVWKDSSEFYIHEDGRLANHDKPIASIEVQGLAYDGLLAAARLFPEKSQFYTDTAEKLRNRTIELLWREERKYFALGIDYSPSGALCTIETPTANPAELLDTAFFDTLSPGDRRKYISSIAVTILGREFLTKAGIRSRALSAWHLVDHWDYHGSNVTWPKETYDIAKGLRRQGMPKLAHQLLENPLLNIVLESKEYPELIYVDNDGQVMHGAPAKSKHGSVKLINAHIRPERIQAWTVSAVIAILAGRIARKDRKQPQPQEPWQAELEKGILSRMKAVNLHLNPISRRKHYPTIRYKLNGTHQS